MNMETFLQNPGALLIELCELKQEHSRSKYMYKITKYKITKRHDISERFRVLHILNGKENNAVKD